MAKEQNNFMQVGKTVECGNCHPDKFEHCAKITERIATFKCECICHDSTPLKEVKQGWEVEFEKKFETMQEDVASSHHLSNFYLKDNKDFISSAITTALANQRESFVDKIEKRKKQYSTEELRDGDWILDDCLSILKE
jgi:hypothetical protein